MLLRYLGGSAIIVRGPFSQRAYSFTAMHPVQMIDGRDVAALLRTRLFRRHQIGRAGFFDPSIGR